MKFTVEIQGCIDQGAGLLGDTRLEVLVSL